ncbi:signal peptidase II [Candidatus Pelagibacter sp.]|jgi:signal peptidase II|nr:signal peptidase II [Candidatus Pelagibacter sp.]
MDYKKILSNFAVVLLIFFTDRFSKIYILKLAELDSKVDIYLTPFLNFYLIWNKGIAFGLFSINDEIVYNFLTIIISIIIFIILIMLIRSRGFQRYSLLMVFGGSLGNLYDRIYFSAVPDFIDFHIGSFHWFIFNVADIFITMGVICLIYAEIFLNKEENEKFN